MKTCFLIPIQGNGLHHLFMRRLFLRGWENYVRDVNKIYKYRKWRGGVVVNHLHKDSCQETVEWSLEARSRKRNPRGRRHTAPQSWSPWKNLPDQARKEEQRSGWLIQGSRPSRIRMTLTLRTIDLRWRHLSKDYHILLWLSWDLKESILCGYMLTVIMSILKGSTITKMQFNYLGCRRNKSSQQNAEKKWHFGEFHFHLLNPTLTPHTFHRSS